MVEAVVGFISTFEPVLRVTRLQVLLEDAFSGGRRIVVVARSQLQGGRFAIAHCQRDFPLRAPSPFPAPCPFIDLWLNS